ncbi:YkgJ family cysteine cluster protein [Gracilibacillus salinarum]|uniref:YkgJ family cysteine cluster protein n=1 Tax=Gracilibacillus salinarum TaxID=2932255 RepID=A0ABY4GNA5_9BACI|nr:YkgJ family cysteine cluster protein [Gracilibacillus salinarum]UOQ85797.1 YkgJ family cysteine cluster protein [Gracilibacillus salinarum]
MESYLTYDEILTKCEQLNEKYSIDEETFYQVVDQLLESDLPTKQKIIKGYQQLMKAVSEEMEQMETAVSLNPTCQMGCAFCCYFPIVINKMEAKVIQHSIDQMPVSRKNKIKHHIKQYYETHGQEVEQLGKLDVVTDGDAKYNYKKAGLPCVMLDTETNQCLAYEIRPLPCRTYVNYTDPSVCKDNEMPKETISYEFLYQEYMGALNELLQYLYAEEDTAMVQYPDDLYQEDLLINWMKTI